MHWRHPWRSLNRRIKEVMGRKPKLNLVNGFCTMWGLLPSIQSSAVSGYSRCRFCAGASRDTTRSLWAASSADTSCSHPAAAFIKPTTTSWWLRIFCTDFKSFLHFLFHCSEGCWDGGWPKVRGDETPIHQRATHIWPSIVSGSCLRASDVSWWTYCWKKYFMKRSSSHTATPLLRTLSKIVCSMILVGANRTVVTVFSKAR